VGRHTLGDGWVLTGPLGDRLLPVLRFRITRFRDRPV